MRSWVWDHQIWVLIIAWVLNAKKMLAAIGIEVLAPTPHLHNYQLIVTTTNGDGIRNKLNDYNICIR
jgi:hypothetical protein